MYWITWTTWMAASVMIPTATAFYPYEPKYERKSGQTRRAPPTSPNLSNTRGTPRRSLTLPLRRVSLRSRENTYDILNSADPKQKHSVAVDQDGSDLSYMAAVTFGSSKEEYRLLLDSAASNTWVMGQDCTSDACGRHNTFGEGDSDTLKTNSKTFSITYGTGSVSGTTAEDTLHIGSIFTPLTFGLATNVSQEFNAYPMDGILGLGKGEQASSLETPQLVQTLASSNLISSKLYGLHLSRAADGTNDGELNLGEVNKDRFDGDLNWLDAMDNDNGFWEIAVANAGADGTMTGLQGKSAIIDTGTSFVFMPEEDAIALHKLIDGFTQSGETFTVPCSTTKELQIKFGDTTYSISTKDWIGGTTDGGCRSNIFGRQTFGDNQWLLGDVFLKNVYTAFDFDNNKVGFGVKSGNDESESSSSTSISASATATASASSGESNSLTFINGPPLSGPHTSSELSTFVPSTSIDPYIAPESSSATATAEVLLPPGALATSSPSGASNSNTATESTPPSSQNQTGGTSRASASMFTLCMGLGIVSLFIYNVLN